MEYLIRGLSKEMINNLRKGRAIELSKIGRNFCVKDDFKGSFQKLHMLGLVDTKMMILDGEEILSLYITNLGINFLNSFN